MFAKNSGFDPLVAENWYTISRDKIMQSVCTPLLGQTIVTLLQGGAKVIDQYNGSVVGALINLFPNIGLDKSKLLALPSMTRNHSLPNLRVS